LRRVLWNARDPIVVRLLVSVRLARALQLRKAEASIVVSCTAPLKSMLVMLLAERNALAEITVNEMALEKSTVTTDLQSLNAKA
jgi:hypothetical protein